MESDGLKLNNNEIHQSQVYKYKPLLEKHFGNNFDFGNQNQVEEKIGTIVIFYKDLAGKDIIPAKFYENVVGTTSYTAEEIKGYKLVEGQESTVKLTISFDGQVVAYIFIYDFISGKDFVTLNHQNNISNDKPWTIVFSQPIDFDSLIKGKSIYITDENNFLWHAECIPGNNIEEVKIVSSSEYKSGETYTLWIINVNNLSGEELKNNYKMSFTIQ